MYKKLLILQVILSLILQNESSAQRLEIEKSESKDFRFEKAFEVNSENYQLKLNSQLTLLEATNFSIKASYTLTNAKGMEVIGEVEKNVKLVFDEFSNFILAEISDLKPDSKQRWISSCKLTVHNIRGTTLKLAVVYLVIENGESGFEKIVNDQKLFDETLEDDFIQIKYGDAIIIKLGDVTIFPY